MGRRLATRTLLGALLAAVPAGTLAARTRSRGSTSASAQTSSRVGGFDLSRLPKGASVTIPLPATTFVPASDRVMLTATDMPQTVSFKPVNLRSGRVGALRLTIYDRNSDRVQYISLVPGTPFLYNFKDLDSITVITPTVGEDGLQLQVESDKPLEISH